MNLLCLSALFGFVTIDIEPLARAVEEAQEIPQLEKQLREASLPIDPKGLLEYLRKHTPSDELRTRLAAAVKKLGDNSFVEREQATEELIKAQRSAFPFLKPALDHADPEVRRRAEYALEEIEKVPYTTLMGTALRMLSQKPPPGAVEALLAYAPAVTDDLIEDALMQALARCGVHEGKPDRLVVAALSDPDRIRRNCAAYAVGTASSSQRKLLEPLLRDADPKVRFQAARVLVRSGHRPAVDDLIAQLETATGSLGWQIEELLGRIAGEKAPAVAVGTDEESRKKCRQAWADWWQANGKGIDLARIDFDDSTLGLSLIAEYDSNAGNGGGKVWLSGRDGKPRWEILDLHGPNDAQLLSGNRILVAERNANRVTERDRNGKVLWESRQEDGAIAAQRVQNGNTLITTWNRVLEVTPDNKTLWEYRHPNGFRYACRLRNGRTLGISASGQVVELDQAGKVLRTFNTPANLAGGAGYWGSVELLPNGRLLVALGSSGKVIEMDEGGKVLWEASVPNAVFATRLRNGNTLVCNFEARQIVEVDRSGKEVSHQTVVGRPFTVRRY
jgi:hypothetical protein